MTDDDLYQLIGRLQWHEDGEMAKGARQRFKLFKDTAGKWTLGWGRNVEDVGISREEADYLLANDIERVRLELAHAFPWFEALDSVRQCAMVEFGFIGLTRLLTFQKALTAMSHRQYGLASDEFYDSNLPKPGQWGPARTAEVCAMIRTGKFQV